MRSILYALDYLIQHLHSSVLLGLCSTPGRLTRVAVTQTQCKECLVVLLYCSMSITSGILGSGAMDYALSHAVNLAEAGKTVQDKRIGEWDRGAVMTCINCACY